MKQIDPIYIGSDAADRLVTFCKGRRVSSVTLICDKNTRLAAGARVAESLRTHGIDVAVVELSGEEIVADADYLLHVFLQSPVDERLFVAVGSGTLTDITRFVSHRSRQQFVSVPTAASVDGFASIGAPLVVRGIKETHICHAPLAIFADLDVLESAPAPLRASGFGDIVGKITSVADWKLGRLLWNEPFDEEIAARTTRAFTTTGAAAKEIGAGESGGLRVLMESLIETGLCMLEFGTSRPASGAEHHVSHYLEMMLLREERPAVLHGAKVGAATVQIAALYEHIRGLSAKEAASRLAEGPHVSREEEISRIRKLYPHSADGVIAAHLPFLDLSKADRRELTRAIEENWANIQEIAAAVPPAQQIRQSLADAGAATSLTSLGFSREEVQTAIRSGHYLRNRFTVVKLARLLGIDPAIGLEAGRDA